ncbi:guanine deaminase [Limnohabitans sp. 2KL-17]|uniref:guanine deaminase n=1 Tax=Limnohabitans sp. 2KL-17 TaxID=1100704 RepID=UPI000D3C0568|nr:guanine deaminase [Limnohabitans sp. 2KL-17]PUE63021.1 guanine deaminase [Limnohabitans sp. 2KL-17]
MPPDTTLTELHGWRAGLLWFPDPQTPLAQHETDGLLVTGRSADGIARVVAIGPYASIKESFIDLPITHWPGLCMAPGFVDLHTHYPQTDVIGSPADGLLPWLEHYTFPHEKQFSDPAYAHEVSAFFLDELMRHGVTTALCFATAHPESVDVFMAEAQKRHLRMITGKVLQDRHSPDGLRDTDTALSLRQTEALIARWHGVDRLGYAITPRFAPTSTPDQLHGAGEIAQQFPDVWIQSHVAENIDEIRWVHELFPEARSYLDVYDRAGLVRQRAIYAHCIHLDETDRRHMAEAGASAAVSPTSNLFLGSGFFDYAASDTAGLRYGLASDVGGGTSFSPFHTMHAAYTVARQTLEIAGIGRPGFSLAPEHLWWQHTAGAAAALDLGGKVGNLLPGCEADFVVLNPKATPLLARRTAQTETLAEWLFAMIVLGDERLVAHTVVQGQAVSDNRA